VSEVGEEAVAGGVFLEAADSVCSSVVFEELGFEHCHGVDGLSFWAFLVVEAFEETPCVRSVDGVEHLFYLHSFSDLLKGNGRNNF